MIEGGTRLHHGIKTLFILPDAQGQFSQQRQLLGEEESGGRRKLELIQEAHTLGPEEITALGQLESVLSAKEPMNAIAQHRALPHKETTLTQHLFDLSGCLPADVHARNEVAP